MKLGTEFKNLNRRPVQTYVNKPYKKYDKPQTKKDKLIVSMLCNVEDIYQIVRNSYFTDIKTRPLLKQDNVLSVIFVTTTDNIHRIYTASFKKYVKHPEDFKIRSVCGYEWIKERYNEK